MDNVDGSRANILESGLCFFSLLPIPISVPPVPMPETNAFTWGTASIISWPVELYWASTFNMLSNWSGLNASFSRAKSSASSRAFLNPPSSFDTR